MAAGLVVVDGARLGARHGAARLLVGLAAVADRASRVDGVVDGEHFWRQAHVLANVDRMLADGLFAVPGAWNEDLFLRLYDVPVWQALVAVASRATGEAPALVAEAGNVAVFAALFAAAWWLTGLLALPRLAGTLALLLLALSPLSRCYAATALPDPFVVLLATLSWAGWLWHGQAGRGAARAAAAGLWLGAGALATLVKCPVYLPVAAAIAWDLWRADRWRALRRPLVLGWALALGAALLLFRWLTAVANAGAVGWPDRATELAWYFGDLAERTSLAAHWDIVQRLEKQVLGRPLALALVFLPAQGLGPGGRRAAGHAVAAVATSLLFLHVNRVHSYYQLPAVLPLALLGGLGLAAAWQGLGAGRAAGALGAVLLGLAALGSQRQVERLRRPDTAAARAAGAFVAAHSEPQDFVLHGTPHSDDNPAWLYFAQRRGANVLAAALDDGLAARWAPFAAARGGRLLAFVPAACAAEAARLAARPGWRQLAAGAPGALFAAP